MVSLIYNQNIVKEINPIHLKESNQLLVSNEIGEKKKCKLKYNQIEHYKNQYFIIQ